MRPVTKALLILEAVICFAPVGLLLFLGVVMAPLQFFVLATSPLNWNASATAVVWVVCGAAGFTALLFVLDRLLRGHGSVSKPMLVCVGVALGIVPLLQMAYMGVQSFSTEHLASWMGTLAVFGLLPLAATAHILFLARRLLFVPWQDGSKRALVAAAAAFVALAVPSLDPSRASSHEIRAQQDLWHERSPARYEFTIQTTGDAPPEAGLPKRIRVEFGKVISVTHAWDLDEDHKAGDPAPADGLWTIDRAFLELLAVEERGGKVNATYNERWGFVEKARADDGSTVSWGVEVRDFSDRSSLPD
jgi:hypothetical protein